MVKQCRWVIRGKSTCACLEAQGATFLVHIMYRFAERHALLAQLKPSAGGLIVVHKQHDLHRRRLIHVDDTEDSVDSVKHSIIDFGSDVALETAHLRYHIKCFR